MALAIAFLMRGNNRYYAGVLASLEGHDDEAIPLVRTAVTGPWGQREEGGGPAYMWRVARLHLSQLEGAAKAPPPR